MASQVKSPKTYLSNAAISAFRAVVISTNGGVDVCPTATLPHGWVQQDAAASEYVAVAMFGGHQTFKAAVSGTPVTVGDALYAGADGYLIKTAGTVTVARCLKTTLTNGEVIEVAALF